MPNFFQFILEILDNIINVGLYAAVVSLAEHKAAVLSQHQIDYRLYLMALDVAQEYHFIKEAFEK